MDSIVNRYKAIFKQELSPLGFKLYKKTFYRVINDVVQVLSFRRDGCTFTVPFNAYPLCLPVDTLYIEDDELTCFEPDFTWLECEDPSAWDASLSRVLALYQKYAKPIFERGTDARSAYLEFLKLEEACASSPRPFKKNEVILAELAMQAGDYPTAYRHMSTYAVKSYSSLQVWEERYEAERAKGPAYERWYSMVIKEIREDIEVYEKLSIPDIDYLHRYVEEKTKISLQYLSKPTSFLGM